MSAFRHALLLEYFKSLEKNTVQVKPQELGILREQYAKIYQQTARKRRPRVFEQLIFSVQLYAAQSVELHPGDDMAYTAFLLKLTNSLNDIVQEYYSAFEITA